MKNFFTVNFITRPDQSYQIKFKSWKKKILPACTLSIAGSSRRSVSASTTFPKKSTTRNWKNWRWNRHLLVPSSRNVVSGWTRSDWRLTGNQSLLDSDSSRSRSTCTRWRHLRSWTTTRTRSPRTDGPLLSSR